LILSIDPGNEFSAFVILDDNLKPIDFGKIPNEELFGVIENAPTKYFVIEMIASYGMGVGQEVFDTCVWIGRFMQYAKEHGNFLKIDQLKRIEEKKNLCHDSRAKDSNILLALVDRFAYGMPNKGKGTAKNKGYFFGFHDDIWAAYAVGVTYSDLYLTEVVK
jgi:hypothetical protein